MNMFRKIIFSAYDMNIFYVNIFYAYTGRESERETEREKEQERQREKEGKSE